MGSQCQGCLPQLPPCPTAGTWVPRPFLSSGAYVFPLQSHHTASGNRLKCHLEDFPGPKKENGNSCFLPLFHEVPAEAPDKTAGSPLWQGQKWRGMLPKWRAAHHRLYITLRQVSFHTTGVLAGRALTTIQTHRPSSPAQRYYSRYYSAQWNMGPRGTHRSEYPKRRHDLTKGMGEDTGQSGDKKGVRGGWEHGENGDTLRTVDFRRQQINLTQSSRHTYGPGNQQLAPLTANSNAFPVHTQRQDTGLAKYQSMQTAKGVEEPTAIHLCLLFRTLLLAAKKTFTLQQVNFHTGRQGHVSRHTVWRWLVFGKKC